MFTVSIGGVDRTDIVVKNSLSIQEVLTSQIDSASFLVKQKDILPTKGQEVIIEYNSNRIFGGQVVEVKKTDRILREYEITCQDWSILLDAVQHAKSYDGMTGKEIIEDLIDVVNTALGTTFTTTNVQDTVNLEKVRFNYLETSKCIEKLTEVLNWQWYVDPDQDIHFFPKGAETAPFDVIEGSDNPHAIQETLAITDSMTQLKNSIVIRGGEFIALARTEDYVADGDQTTFPLAYKFSNLPAVTVDSVSQVVGVEGIDNTGLTAGDFDCLWSFQEKFIRFRNDNKPANGDAVAITGTPKFPLVIQAEDPISIAEYGLRQATVTDTSITSITVGIQRGLAELDAWKDGVQSGGFQTYSDGLKSGQYIRVVSEKLDVDEYFLIRSVTMTEHGLESALYNVELASNRVLGIIELLQKLLLKDKDNLNIDENAIPNVVKLISEDFTCSETITKVDPETVSEDFECSESIAVNPFEAEFVLANYFPTGPTDPKTPMRLGISSYIYPDP